MAYHRPVLLDQSIGGLEIQPKGVYVDLTFGGGGHSRKVLEQLGKKGRLFAFDQDSDAEQNLPDDKRITFVKSNFRYLQNFLRYYGVDAVDGILADLGISSYQIDKGDRGFSFRADADLDMRMNQSSQVSAITVLNEYKDEALYKMFREYGELKSTGRIVKAILEGRKQRKISTTKDLEAVLQPMLPKATPSKFLAQVYQAIRIEVNQEMQALKEMLLQTGDCLAPGGRLVVISYHSLEDKLVKNYLKSGNLEGVVKKDFYGNPETIWKPISRGVIVPDEDELKENTRSRSAKMRIAERL